MKTIFSFFLSLWVRYQGNPHKQRRAIRVAKKKHEQDGKRYRVFFLGNRYQALTRDDIQRRKHEHAWGWHVNSTSLGPYCFYDTNLTTGHAPLQQQQQQ